MARGMKLLVDAGLVEIVAHQSPVNAYRLQSLTAAGAVYLRPSYMSLSDWRAILDEPRLECDDWVQDQAPMDLLKGAGEPWGASSPGAPICRDRTSAPAVEARGSRSAPHSETDSFSETSRLESSTKTVPVAVAGNGEGSNLGAPFEGPLVFDGDFGPEPVGGLALLDAVRKAARRYDCPMWFETPRYREASPEFLAEGLLELVEGLRASFRLFREVDVRTAVERLVRYYRVLGRMCGALDRVAFNPIYLLKSKVKIQRQLNCLLKDIDSPNRYQARRRNDGTVSPVLAGSLPGEVADAVLVEVEQLWPRLHHDQRFRELAEASLYPMIEVSTLEDPDRDDLIRLLHVVAGHRIPRLQDVYWACCYSAFSTAPGFYRIAVLPESRDELDALLAAEAEELRSGSGGCS